MVWRSPFLAGKPIPSCASAHRPFRKGAPSHGDSAPLARELAAAGARRHGDLCAIARRFAQKYAQSHRNRHLRTSLSAAQLRFGSCAAERRTDRGADSARSEPSPCGGGTFRGSSARLGVRSFRAAGHISVVSAEAAAGAARRGTLMTSRDGENKRRRTWQRNHTAKIGKKRGMGRKKRSGRGGDWGRRSAWERAREWVEGAGEWGLDR